MSAQTDCEMLSIEVMEAYAGKYNLSGNKVVELFQKNQVFEKMLIQHEYLHQVSFEEVMEFVENAIADDSRELVVYHGTCSEFEKINLNKSHNRRDFGKGFYTTILQSQSKEWVRNQKNMQLQLPSRPLLQRHRHSPFRLQSRKMRPSRQL